MLLNRLCKAIVHTTSLRLLGASSSLSLRRSFALYCMRNSRKTVLPITSSFLTRCRNYSDESESQSDYVKLPPLTDDKPLVYPSFFKSLRSFIQVFFVIKPYLDMDFVMNEFLEGAKQALHTVSHKLATEDYEGLEGLVTQDMINILRNKISMLSSEQKALIATQPDDIYAMFPYEVGVMFDNNNAEQKFVEITVVYYVMKGLKKLKENPQEISMPIGMNPQLRRNAFVCNYRFIREFTKGVESAWTVNKINHFMPDNL
ncbi:m-AAA protease-interacting protein 1, mitochondrial [Copidosoma floridanum]|uniref:m-AAA protease-interacting protein 1, mitochondrial n=1 Tax=Copidosoma floridanum TaxID=29053 RepID=UPI0006C949C6|nr:m-AAA protease-interacting protein 1, mitochondrial [Copidosoma floridanum]